MGLLLWLLAWPLRRQGEVALGWPSADAFYGSHPWRRARIDALEANRERYGTLTCECCRSRSASQWHVDHIRPRSSHPELALTAANLQVLCADCNLGKGMRHATDWRYQGQLTRTQKRSDRAINSRQPPIVAARACFACSTHRLRPPEGLARVATAIADGRIAGVHPAGRQLPPADAGRVRE